MEAFKNITAALSKPKRAQLSGDIAIVEARLAKRLPGDFWNDPERAAKAKAKMRLAHALNTNKLKVTARSTGVEEICNSYADVAKIVGYAVSSIKCYVSLGDGTADFEHGDEVYTVKRLT